MKLSDLNKSKNYLSNNLISLFGYLCSFYWYYYTNETKQIFNSPGADETVEAYAHSFNGISSIIFELIILCLLIFCFVIEIYIKNRFNIKYIKDFQSIKILKQIHSIFYWIGIVLLLIQIIPILFFIVIIIFMYIFYQ